MDRFRERSAWVLLADLKDWPRLETLLQGRVDPHAELEPRNGRFWTDHSRAPQAEYARALAMQGRHAEALPLFEQAMYSFVRPYRFLHGRYRYPEWRRWETAELYAESLDQTGDHDKAVEWQKWALVEYEKHVAVGGKLLSRIAAARCAWKLVELLEAAEPGQVDRRLELLDRAAELLDAPETAPRLLPAEREMRAEIEAAKSLVQ